MTMRSKVFAVDEGAMLSHTASPAKRVLLVQPRGDCAGMDRAAEAVERALKRHGSPVYVRNEIVPNQHVVAMLRERGVAGRAFATSNSAETA
jgi:4-hydroxy-3-methylbut-2-enyl diphosphate reductase